MKQRAHQNLLKAEQEVQRMDGVTNKSNQQSENKGKQPLSDRNKGHQDLLKIEQEVERIDRVANNNQQSENKSNQPLVDKKGHQDLLKIEQEVQRMDRRESNLFHLHGSSGLPFSSLSYEADIYQKTFGSVFSLGAQIEATVVESSVKPDPNLRNFNTVTATLETSIYVGSEIDGKKIPLKINAAGKVEFSLGGTPVSTGTRTLKGDRVTIEGKIPAEGSGKDVVPNPFDPLSMPVGSAVVVKNEVTTVKEDEFSYKWLHTESSVTHTDGEIARGIERMGDNRVRIYSGDTQAVENEFYVGLGKRNFSIGLQPEKSLSGEQVRTADIDLNTPAGREAYNRFILTGEVPAAGPGVEPSGEVGSLKLNNSLSIRANVGDIQATQELFNQETEHRVTDYIDYTSGKPEVKKDVTTTYASYGDRTLYIERTYDQNGVPVKSSSDQKPYNVVISSVDPQSADATADAFKGADKPTGRGRQDVRLSFTDAEAKELQEMASKYVAENDPRGGLDLLHRIAAANSTDEVMIALTDNGSNGDTTAQLQLLSLYSDRPIPGSVEFQDVP